MNILQKLRWVVLESPYDSWANEKTGQKTRDLFEKTIGLKLAGYRREYSYGVLPVDTTDFIAIHQLICEEREDGLYPLLGYKTVTWERAKLHNLPFPGLNLVRASQAPLHERAVQAILDDCQKKAISIAYDSSWTMAAEARANPELKKTLREMFTAFYVLFHDAYRIQQLIGGGTIRFKTDEYFKYWGYEPISWNGEVLPPIHNPQLLGEPVRVMHLREFSEEAREVAARWKLFWKRALIIEGKPEVAAVPAAIPFKRAA
jgi:hypothetical protein